MQQVLEAITAWFGGDKSPHGFWSRTKGESLSISMFSDAGQSLPEEDAVPCSFCGKLIRVGQMVTLDGVWAHRLKHFLAHSKVKVYRENQWKFMGCSESGCCIHFSNIVGVWKGFLGDQPVIEPVAQLNVDLVYLHGQGVVVRNTQSGALYALPDSTLSSALFSY